MHSGDNIYPTPWFHFSSIDSRSVYDSHCQPTSELPTADLYNDYGAQCKRAGCSTPKEVFPSQPTAHKSCWQRDLTGEIYYVEPSVIYDAGELDLEAQIRRPHRSRATRGLHAHLPWEDFQRFGHVLTDPLPGYISPPPKPAPRVLSALPMSSDYTQGVPDSQHPRTVGCYRQRTPEMPELEDRLSSLLIHTPPPPDYSSSCSFDTDDEEHYIAQPQPVRVVRIDLMEMFNNTHQTSVSHRGSQRQDAFQMQRIATHCASQKISDSMNHKKEGFNHTTQVRVSRRKAETSPELYSHTSPSPTIKPHRRKDPVDELGEISLSTPDSGYASGVSPHVSWPPPKPNRNFPITRHPRDNPPKRPVRVMTLFAYLYEWIRRRDVFDTIIRYDAYSLAALRNS